MKIQLLPSSFDVEGGVSQAQHTTCFIIADRLAIDAGSLAQAATEQQRDSVRDIVLSHAHLDHIAGLPLFVDDLFAALREPVRVHASQDVIDILERDIFNWSVYPRFSELRNEFGKVLEYVPLEPMKPTKVADFSVTPLFVNHKVPSTGFIVSNGDSTIVITGDTAEMDNFWTSVNSLEKLDGLLIECAFPDEMLSLAEVSHHLTPKKLATELKKFDNHSCPVYVVNIKPLYRAHVIEQLKIECPDIHIFKIGEDYDL